MDNTETQITRHRTRTNKTINTENKMISNTNPNKKKKRGAYVNASAHKEKAVPVSNNE